MVGSGIYIQQSRYINNRAATNNSLIGGTSSYYFIAQCYSNSTSGDRAYFRFPDGDRVYSESNHYSYSIGQLNYTGVQISRRYWPNIYGIFTCEVPDSRGIMVETSIGIYSSRPSKFFNYHSLCCLLFSNTAGAPSVYSIAYNNERHHVSSDDVLGSVNCLSENSPPTIVTWTRDGSTIEVDGQDYEMMQIVLERRLYSRFKNTLLIKNLVELVGNHRYCCRVSNSAGTSSSRCVATSWTGVMAIA